MLRQLDMPLATIKELLACDRPDGAERIDAYWKSADAVEDARRGPARDSSINSTERGRHVRRKTREMPERRVLCLKRNVDEAGAWALGKEFIAIMRERPAPKIPGIEGAVLASFGAR